LDLSPAGGNNELTLISVVAGRLVGTAAGYLGANIQVGAGAEVAFNAPNVALASVFANNIEGIGGAGGTGSVVKVGAGEALLGSVNLNANTPDFKVEQGILTLTDSRAGSGIPMLTANVSAGATFRVKIANARSLGSEITGTGKLDLQSDATIPGVKLVRSARSRRSVRPISAATFVSTSPQFPRSRASPRTPVPSWISVPSAPAAH